MCDVFGVTAIVYAQKRGKNLGADGPAWPTVGVQRGSTIAKSTAFFYVSVCWTNIVSTLLLLGIRSLNALLAHSIAVNTSYRSSLGTTNPGIQALIALDLVIRRK